MSIGSINTFPIQTIMELATSGQHGLSPIFEKEIRAINLANPNAPASELAIRNAIDQISAGQVFYENIGLGEGIYHGMSLCGDVALYNTLSFSGDITGFIEDNTIILSGAGAEAISLSEITTAFSVQGGLNQYTNVIDASAIQVSGTLISNAKQDDVLGKIFLKCFSPFDSNLSTYSIGTTSNNQLITTLFNAPSAIGLVPFTYSNNMSGEYYWLSGNDDIYLFRYGSLCTNGQLGISIFYDNVIWAPDYGYRFGGYASNQTTINRLDLSNLTYSNRDSQLNVVRNNHASLMYNDYIYNGGGSTDGTNGNVQTTVDKFNSKNDTVAAASTSMTLQIALQFMSSATNSVYGYYLGGTYSIGTVQTIKNTIQKIDYASSVAYTSRALLTATYEHGKGQTSTHAYIFGGRTASTTYTTNKQKYKFSDDTTTVGAAAMTTAKGAVKTIIDSSDNHFIIGGHNATLSYNSVDKFVPGAETYSASYVMPINVHSGVAVKNSVSGFYIGGVYFNSSPSVNVNIPTILKVDLATVSWSVIETTCESIYQYDGASV